MSEPFVIVEVYENDGQTLIAELPRRSGVVFSEPLNVPGTGQIRVDPEDDVVTRHPTIFDMGRVVKFWLGDGAGAGEYVSAFRIRHRATEYVADGEWSSYLRTLSGPTIHADLDRFIVKHEVAPVMKSPEVRMFGWASKQGPWYDAADWAEPYVSNIWTNPSTPEKEGNPKRWPDPKAYWLYGGASPIEYWRAKFTLSAQERIRIYFSSDENGRVFLDGEEVIATRSREIGYTEMSKYTTILEAGEHTLGVRSTWQAGPNNADGHDEMILTVCTVLDDGSPGRVIKRTKPGDAWELFEGDTPPGWTKADILRTMIVEAQNRGNEWANYLTLGFNGTVDSNSDPWTDEMNRYIPIGTTILDLQAQLSEHGQFDVWIDPDTFEVQAWLQRGSDKTSSITLEPGRNLLGWSVEEEEDVRNVLVVRYKGGWAEVSDSASVTEFGTNEAFVKLGNVIEKTSAEDTGNKILSTKKAILKAAGRGDQVSYDEDEQPSGALISVPGAVPMLDFGPGDAVKALNADIELTSHIVLSLTCTEDDATGLLTWDPELYEANF